MALRNMALSKESTTSECALFRLPNETLLAILLASDPEDVFSMEKVLIHIGVTRFHHA